MGDVIEGIKRGKGRARKRTRLNGRDKGLLSAPTYPDSDTVGPLPTVHC